MAIDILILVMGIYLAAQTLKMKATGEIPRALVSKRVDVNKCRDKESFIKVMYPKNIIFVIILIIAALLGIAANYVILPTAVVIGVYVLYLGALVYYAIISVKYQTKYLL